MHPVLTFLADAVRYAQVFKDRAGPLRVVHLQDILRHVCSDALSLAEITSLTSSLDTQASSGYHPLPAIDKQLLEHLMTRGLTMQLARIAVVLRDLIMLHEALHRGDVRHVRLQVNDRLLFDAIRKVSFDYKDGQPQHVLVGTLEWGDDERVGPYTRPDLLTQVGITYHPKKALPHLNLTVGSKSNIHAWEANRTDFPHEPVQRSILSLGRREGKIRGQIITRSIQEPVNISNKVYELTVSPNLKLELIQTDVLDEHGNSLLICQRVAVSHKQ